MSQGPPDPYRFIQEKVQKGDFLKTGIDFLFVLLMFLCMNHSKAWNAKLEAILFWPSKNLYKQAVCRQDSGFVCLTSCGDPDFAVLSSEQNQQKIEFPMPL